MWISSGNVSTGELLAVSVDPDGTIHPAELVNDKSLNLGMDQSSQGGDYLSASNSGTRPYVAWVDRRVTPQAAYVSWRGP